MTKHQPIPAETIIAPTEQDTHASPILPDDAVVPVTPRHDGWTPDRQRSFIETLADTGCVITAAEHVGMSPSSAYRLRRRTDARAFDAAWDAALERSLERLLPVAITRALHGTLKPRWYHGEVIAQEHVVSERLLLWLLEKGAAMLGNSRARQAMRADWDAALEGVGLEESKAPEPDRPHRIWPDEARKAWLTDAPPEPGYDGWCRGKPGEPYFARYLQPEEKEALERAEETPQVSPWQDEARRRFFGLERIKAYEPEDADAWLHRGKDAGSGDDLRDDALPDDGPDAPVPPRAAATPLWPGLGASGGLMAADPDVRFTAGGYAKKRMPPGLAGAAPEKIRATL